MKRTIPFVAAMLAVTLLASPAFASTLFQGLGMFQANAPTNKYMAPGKSFYFSFDLASSFPSTHPVVGTTVTTAAENFIYKLSDMVVPATLSSVTFLPTGFRFRFSDDYEMTFVGDDIASGGTVIPPTSGFYNLVIQGSPTPSRVASRAAGPTIIGGGWVVTSAMPAAVPEPATWGLMLLGFGGVGAALRRRSRTAFARALAA